MRAASSPRIWTGEHQPTGSPCRLTVSIYRTPPRRLPGSSSGGPRRDASSSFARRRSPARRGPQLLLSPPVRRVLPQRHTYFECAASDRQVRRPPSATMLGNEDEGPNRIVLSPPLTSSCSLVPQVVAWQKLPECATSTSNLTATVLYGRPIANSRKRSRFHDETFRRSAGSGPGCGVVSAPRSSIDLVDVAPAPAFGRVIALDHRMLRRLEMLSSRDGWASRRSSRHGRRSGTAADAPRASRSSGIPRTRARSA